MAANDFILVIGEGWIEVPNATTWINTTVGEGELQGLCNGSDWPTISQYLEDGGYIAPNTQIIQARMFNNGTPPGDGDNLRFWFRQ